VVPPVLVEQEYPMHPHVQEQMGAGMQQPGKVDAELPQRGPWSLESWRLRPGPHNRGMRAW